VDGRGVVFAGGGRGSENHAQSRRRARGDGQKRQRCAAAADSRQRSEARGQPERHTGCGFSGIHRSYFDRLRFDRPGFHCPSRDRILRPVTDDCAFDASPACHWSFWQWIVRSGRAQDYAANCGRFYDSDTVEFNRIGSSWARANLGKLLSAYAAPWKTDRACPAGG